MRLAAATVLLLLGGCGQLGSMCEGRELCFSLSYTFELDWKPYAGVLPNSHPELALPPR